MAILYLVMRCLLAEAIVYNGYDFGLEFIKHALDSSTGCFPMPPSSKCCADLPHIDRRGVGGTEAYLSKIFSGDLEVEYHLHIINSEQMGV